MTDYADPSSDDCKWQWLQTYTGKEFFPMDPQADAICIEDIAIGLSREPRYNGHTVTAEPYSVAQHCILAARVAPTELKLWALLHDASEAYCKDMTYSVKYQLPEYKKLEKNILRVIAEKYNLGWPEPAEVKVIDNRLLATEQRDLMEKPPRPWRDLPEPYDFKILVWDHRHARRLYLATFHALMADRANREALKNV